MKLLHLLSIKKPGISLKWLPGFLFFLMSAQYAVAQIKLENLSGKQVDFEQVVSGKFNVILFVSPTCPLCKKYGKALFNLENEFQSKGVNFIYIFSGTDHELVAMKAFILNNRLKGRSLKDKNTELARYLKADKTPEVFLLNKKKDILYWGAIDNFAFEVGRTRTVTTQFYLKNALQSSIENKPIKLTHMEAIGCFIE